MEQKKYYRIVRTVKEIYHVEAYSREGALNTVALHGNPSEIKIVKETVRQINKNS